MMLNSPGFVCVGGAPFSPCTFEFDGSVTLFERPAAIVLRNRDTNSEL